MPNTAAAIFKWLAEQVKPYAEPEVKPIASYNVEGKTNEEVFAKTHEALLLFQGAAIESGWDMEECLLLLDAATKRTEDYKHRLADMNEALSGYKGSGDAEKITVTESAIAETQKEIDAAGQLVGKWKAKHAEAAAKNEQQNAFITVLKARLKCGSDDLINHRFSTTDEIMVEAAK